MFSHLRIIDLSVGVAGPLVTMLAAQHGAEVVDVEQPGGGWAPSSCGDRVRRAGKRSEALDLSARGGVEQLCELTAGADVVVHSCAPAEAERLGVDHRTLAARDPRAITLAIDGYGDHPRHRDRPADDALVMARTGLLHDQRGRVGGPAAVINRWPAPHTDLLDDAGAHRGAGRPGPVFPCTPWPSVGAAHLGFVGLTAALFARERTGRGQHVHTSLLQGALAAASLTWQRVERPDAELYWMWQADRRSIDGLYRCADGRWVHHWTIRPHWVLASAAGESLVAARLDGTYRTDPDRLSMGADDLVTGYFLQPLLAEAFAKFPAADWEAAAAEAGVGIVMVRSPAEALADPALLADGLVIRTDHPVAGPILHVGSPLHVTPVDSAPDTSEVAGTTDCYRAPGGGIAHGPLAGVRVVDLGVGVAGPFAGRMLADLGAEVIRVDAPHDTFWAGTHLGLATNRGKRSIAVDLAAPGGPAVVRTLIAGADVVCTNWRPGVAERLGLDWDAIRAAHPRLILCQIRGYERGFRSALPATDQTAAAMAGTEWADGGCDHGNPPMWSRSSMGDTGAALLAAAGICAALHQRERTGLGQRVDTSILGAALLHTSHTYAPADIHADRHADRHADMPHGGGSGTCAGIDAGQFGLGSAYRLYLTAGDGWIFVAAITDEQRAALTTVLGGDPREEVFAGRSAEEWFSLLDAAGVPAEIVDERFCAELFDDPDAWASGLVAGTTSMHVGSFEDVGMLVNFSDTPGSVRRGPCACGEHSAEILAESGYGTDSIAALLSDGTVFDTPVLDAGGHDPGRGSTR